MKHGYRTIEEIYGKKFYATDLLRQRCQEVGIEPPTTQPIDDNCIVWRLPPLEKSKGGLWIPEEERSPHIKGILMSIGPRGRDFLYSNGVKEGHIVKFKRFAGVEGTDKTQNRDLGQEFLTLKARDIDGSDDLSFMLASGEAKYITDEKSGRTCLQVKLLGGRKEKLLALAASTTSPHEAETARRIANGS